MEIALCGIGKIARDQHVPSLETSDDWTLAATVSRHGTVDGVLAFTDLGSLFREMPDVGVVSLCTPPGPRFDQAKEALAAGKHVMLEKPPGASLAECHALSDLARAAGRTIYATWHSREATAVPAAKAWLAGKRLRRLAITWKEDVRRWHPGQEWIWEPAGFGVFDPGINALSILTEILADPIHVTGAVLEVPENRQTAIGASIEFAHPDGAEVSAVFDWRQEGEQTWTIEAETDAGHMVLSAGGETLSIDGKPVDPGEDGVRGEYPRLYANMARLVKDGGIDMDLRPLTIVADAMMLGRRDSVAPFIW